MTVKMGVPQQISGLVAGEDMSSFQYCAVQLQSGADNTAYLADSADGQPSCGALQNDPESGEVCIIDSTGPTMVKLGASVTRGAFLMVEQTTARYITHTGDTAYVVGQAMQSGADGDVVPAILFHPWRHASS